MSIVFVGSALTGASCSVEPSDMIDDLDRSVQGMVDEPPLVVTAPNDVPCRAAELMFAPEFRMDGYSEVDAFWMMWFAYRATESDDPATADELFEIGFTDYEAIDIPSVGLQAFVANHPDVAVLSFRGSNDIMDWVTNLGFAQIRADALGLRGNVHVGFFLAFSAGWAAISSALDAMELGDKPIWITGHSLGGAMAVLAAARLLDEGYRVAPLYSFANPRTLNSEAAQDLFEQLDGQVYRHVNEQDLVPRLPPSAGAAESIASILPLGPELVTDLDYTHVGTMFHYRRPGLFRPGRWQQLPTMDEGDDVAYWQGVDTLNWLVLLGATQVGTWHDRGRYLCRMRKPVFGF